MTFWFYSLFLPGLVMMYEARTKQACEKVQSLQQADFFTVKKGKTTMSSTEMEQTGSVRASSPSRLGNRMEYLYWEIPGCQALRVMADIHDLVRTGVEDPSAIKLEVLGQEIRIRSNTDIVAQAKRYNGADVWIVQAEIQIRQHYRPNQPRFQF